MLNKNKFLSDQHRKNNFVPKKKEDKKNRICAWVLVILIAFCTVCSFLSIGLVVKDCRKVNADEASSSEGVVFVSDPLPFSIASNPTVYGFDNGSLVTDTVNLALSSTFYTVSFYKSVSGLYPQITFSEYSSNGSSSVISKIGVFQSELSTVDYNFYGVYRFLSESSVLYCFSQSFGVPFTFRNFIENYKSTKYPNVKFTDFDNISSDSSSIVFRLSKAFNFDTVYKYSFSCSHNSSLSWSYNFVYTYFDGNDNKLEISSLCYGFFGSDTYSEYYFNKNSENEYEKGYNAGFSDGKISSDNIVYQNGFNIGKQQGYSQGYNAGVESANKYTFLSLISSVVDAPIKALSGMLNFNILGFNMLDFFYALITLAVIIAVVRLIL